MKMSHRLVQLLPGLLSTRSELPFGFGPTARAFVVQTGGATASEEAVAAAGGRTEPTTTATNFVIYGSSYIGDYIKNIDEIGGIQKQFLGHRDEASKFCNVLSAPLWCHELEKVAVQAKGCQVADTFSESKHVLLEDKDGNEVFTAYHTPGHTVGSSSYLWRNVGEGFSVLFTGDALAVKSKQEVSASLQFHPYKTNIQDQVKSVELMLRLKPTYIVPALSMDNDNFIFEFKDLPLQKLHDNLCKRNPSA